MTKDEGQMTKDDVKREALRLFRVVHGEGDDGGPFAFQSLNGAVKLGWLRLARHVLLRELKAEGPRVVEMNAEAEGEEKGNYE